jgi:hypothetical protein
MELKVGLGLGIPLAVIITACATYFLLRRRNRRADGVATSQYYYPPAEHEGTVYSGVPKQPVEVMGHATNELYGDFPGQRPRYELT